MRTDSGIKMGKAIMAVGLIIMVVGTLLGAYYADKTNAEHNKPVEQPLAITLTDLREADAMCQKLGQHAAGTKTEVVCDLHAPDGTCALYAKKTTTHCGKAHDITISFITRTLD